MNPNLTEIAYVLDRSGSMAPMAEAAIGGFNAFLQEQLDEPGDVNLSLLLFDDEFLKPHDRVPLHEVGRLDAATYVPRGCTALLDAIGLTIDELGGRLAADPEEARPAKVIVAVFTDGCENASRRYTLERINGMITHQREKYGWEFMFLAANQDAIATAARMGIDRDMAGRVDACDVGVGSSSAAFSRKMSALRKMGAGEVHEDYLKPLGRIAEEEQEKRKK